MKTHAATLQVDSMVVRMPAGPVWRVEDSTGLRGYVRTASIAGAKIGASKLWGRPAGAWRLAQVPADQVFPSMHIEDVVFAPTSAEENPLCEKTLARFRERFARAERLQSQSSLRR